MSYQYKGRYLPGDVSARIILSFRACPGISLAEILAFARMTKESLSEHKHRHVAFYTFPDYFIVMEYFKAGDILINVEYRKIKTIRITVYPPDGETRIFAPVNADDDSIIKFAASKIHWIEKHREKFRRAAAVKNHQQNDKTHFVWGSAYNLEIIEKAGYSKISLEDNVLKMKIPPGTSADKKQQILDKWYHRLLAATAPALVEKWEKITGLKIKQIFYRKMKTHWGSCNPKKQTIRLNTELAKKPLFCLEYVIVHEMLHLIESAHNQNFYRLMEKYIPNWKTIRRQMNNGEV